MGAYFGVFLSFLACVCSCMGCVCFCLLFWLAGRLNKQFSGRGASWAAEFPYGVLFLFLFSPGGSFLGGRFMLSFVFSRWEGWGDSGKGHFPVINIVLGASFCEIDCSWF